MRVMSERYARMTITLPPEIKARVDLRKSKVNWSAIAAEAFSVELARQDRLEGIDMNETFERFQELELTLSQKEESRGFSTAEAWAGDIESTEEFYMFDKLAGIDIAAWESEIDDGEMSEELFKLMAKGKPSSSLLKNDPYGYHPTAELFWEHVTMGFDKIGNFEEEERPSDDFVRGFIRGSRRCGLSIRKPKSRQRKASQSPGDGGRIRTVATRRAAHQLQPSAHLPSLAIRSLSPNRPERIHHYRTGSRRRSGNISR